MPSEQEVYCKILDLDYWPPPVQLFPAPCPLLEFSEPWQTPRNKKWTLWAPKTQVGGGERVCDTWNVEPPMPNPPFRSYTRHASTTLRCLPPKAERGTKSIPYFFPSPQLLEVWEKDFEGTPFLEGALEEEAGSNQKLVLTEACCLSDLGSCLACDCFSDHLVSQNSIGFLYCLENETGGKKFLGWINQSPSKLHPVQKSQVWVEARGPYPVFRMEMTHNTDVVLLILMMVLTPARNRQQNLTSSKELQ